MSTKTLLDDLVDCYGESALVPSKAQWNSLLTCSHKGAIAMVNFIALNEHAKYDDGRGGSGMDAMLCYYELARKKVLGVGGEFIIEGLDGGGVIGEDQQWDAIGIVRYPSCQAFLDVFADAEYRANHFHRVAATRQHRMTMMML